MQFSSRFIFVSALLAAAFFLNVSCTSDSLSAGGGVQPRSFRQTRVIPVIPAEVPGAGASASAPAAPAAFAPPSMVGAPDESGMMKPFSPTTIDGTLATVGDQMILLSDLQNAVHMASHFEATLLSSGQLVGKNFTAEQGNQLLQNLIDQKVLQIKAQSLGFDVTEDELTARINEYVKQQGGTEADLEEQLKRSGKTMAEYRTEFKNEIIKQQLIGRAIAPLVTVTDDDVNNFYLQQTKDVKQISTVQLRSLMIYLNADEVSDPKKNLTVQEVQGKIAVGVPFVTLVKDYSQAVDAAKTDGLLAPRRIETLPPVLSAQLTHLAINQVLGPVVIGNSAFFFQYLGAEFEKGSDLKRNFASWKTKLQNVKFNDRLVEYLKSEKNNIKIVIRPFKIRDLDGK